MVLLLVCPCMRTAEFHYQLPPELIAQRPVDRRDGSRLLVLHRESGRIEHRHFPNLTEYLRPGDLLVLNNSRVIPARLRGRNVKTGGAFEMLLLEENAINDWWVMIKPGKRANVGTQILIDSHALATPDRKQPSPPIPLTATVLETNAEGHRRLQFHGVANVLSALDAIGEMPLPPYIRRDPAAETAESERDALQWQDRERYQTVFAQSPGSVAAPTAGLHFTPELLAAVQAHGVDIQFVTLHVGLGTFAPVKAETLDAHIMHEERYEISEATARAVNLAKAERRRVIAVGTTCVRLLESAATPPEGTVKPGRGRTRIFIHPPRDFQVVDALLTNFHLPCSTLLMLVSAFATPGDTRGRDLVLSTYEEAIRERYRFFSYGDAMLIS